MVLEKYARELYLCNRCGYCREMIDPTRGVYGICPSWEARGFESYTARGTIHIARAIYEGRLRPTKHLAEHVFSKCLLCKNCQTHCPLEVDIISVTKALRQDLFQAGLLPEPLKERDSDVRRNHNVFGEVSSDRTNWASGLELPRKGPTLYFAGCYDAYRYPQTARATVAILKEAGVDVAYLGEDEWCCGLPQLHDGNIVLAEENIKHNLDVIKKSGAKRVVTSCPGCYTALKSEYAKLIGKIPFEVIHISEFIAKLINAGKIASNEVVNKKVTYHDPCHLGRYEGVYEEPRKVIQAINGVELVEMQKNRENAMCCGAGTEVYIMDPDLATSIAKTRVEEAEETGAEAIVTACPMCVTNLKPAAKKAGIEVYDLPMFIAASMGLKV